MSELVFNETTHEYKLNGTIIPSVTQIIKNAGLINFDFVNENLLKQKADLGDKIHSTTELYDKQSLDEKLLHPILSTYLKAWKKFILDYNYSPAEIELQLFHEIYKYAGRIDRIGLVNGILSIIEIKSGVYHKSHYIQTAGYELLYNQNKKKSDCAKKRIIVYLNPEGYLVKEAKNENDKNIFLAALTVSNYKRSSE